uniref:hypothetical protein n=1 Tax=Trichocoleus desertorum TaxID=1481672 RepID=UPI0025B2D22F|nr:hypothetical protein [Trichocoleus desertorum]
MTAKLTLAELNQRLEIVEAQQQWFSRVLETYGIRGLWLSPGKAAPLLGVSRDRIMAEIERAERMRATNQKGDLIYGAHYRNIGDPESELPTWQVHVAEFEKLLAIPPDQRKL